MRGHLDGVLVHRGFALTPQPPSNCDDESPRAVYEANPDDFNRRYPAIALGGGAPCIDLWIELDSNSGTLRGTLEGTPVGELSRMLGVTAPTSGPAGTEVSLQLTGLGARLGEILDAAKRYLLPERLRAKVRSFPEMTKGARRMALVLATGQVVEDVVVEGFEIVSVGGKEPQALPLYATVDVIDRTDASGAR